METQNTENSDESEKDQDEEENKGYFDSSAYHK
jgi:hypothetical protein